MIPADVLLLDSRIRSPVRPDGESDAVEKICLTKADGQSLDNLLETRSLASWEPTLFPGRATALVPVVSGEDHDGSR